MSEQQFNFDKFVRDLDDRARVQNERRERLKGQEQNWQTRELHKKYREHPHNRIVTRDNNEN